MAGNATLDPDILVDDLVETVDELRQDLADGLGTRMFRVYTVVRTWEGSRVGEGEYTDTEVEILPPPFVAQWFEEAKMLHYEQELCGINEAGYIELREVSLSYTYEDLLAHAPAEENVQHLIKLTERHGQGQPVRYFVHSKPPMPDRDRRMGWTCQLTVVD